MNLRRSYSVTQLAEHLAMSERTFARFYRGATGSTPAAAVQQIRVDAACRLLGGSHLSVKAIASRCGFASSEGHAPRVHTQPAALATAVPTDPDPHPQAR